MQQVSQLKSVETHHAVGVQNTQTTINSIEPITKQAHIQITSLAMKSAISLSDQLLQKINSLDFEEFTSMPMLAETQGKEYEPIHLNSDEKYPSNHAFSIDYWSNISSFSPKEKEEKIKIFMGTCLSQFKNKMTDQEAKQSFSEKGAFKKYVLSMKEHNHFPFFITLCAQYYTLLSHCKNHDLTLKMLTQFPPRASDMNCIDGTIARLLSAISELNWGMGRGSPFDHFVQQGIEKHFNKIFTEYKLYQHVYAGHQVHLKPYLHYVLGVPREKIIKNDHNFNTPRSDLTAEAVHAFISSLQTTVSKVIIENLKEEISEFSRLISKKDFSSNGLQEIRNSKLIKLIKSIENSFDVDGYMKFKTDENGEESCTNFEWNEVDLYADILKMITQNKNKEIKKEKISFEYQDAFKLKHREKIVSALMSDNIENFESAIHLLFVLSQRYKGASPIEFFNLLLLAGSRLGNLKTFDRSRVEDKCQAFVTQLKNKCTSNTELEFLSEKIDSIQDRLDVYLRNDPDKAQNIHPYILLLNNELDTSDPSYLNEVVNTLISGYASAETFRFIIGNDIDKINIKNLSNLIAYSPDRKEILKFFHSIINEDKLISLLEKSIKIKDDQMMRDIFNVFNIKYSIWGKKKFIASGVFGKIFYFSIKNKQFEFINNFLISQKNSIILFNNRYLFSLVIKSIQSGDISIFNKIIRSISKEQFFKNDKLWIDRTCDVVNSGKKEAIELLAQKYFDSNIKEMLFSIKKSNNITHSRAISNAIFSSCLQNSTEILDVLLQNGCSVQDIIKLISCRFHPSIFFDLDSTNLFNRYPRPEIESGVNRILTKRDDIVMWLIDHGCPLSKFQKQIVNDEESQGYSFIHRCAQKLEFNLLAKMLISTKKFNHFMKASTPGGKDVLFLAARAGSRCLSARDFIQAALDHPTRSQTLNQPDKRGWTPLHEAVSKGDVTLLELLLDDSYLKLSDIEAKTKGLFLRYTPILSAHNALKKETNIENQRKIEQCMTMLENKKRQLINNNFNLRLTI